MIDRLLEQMPSPPAWVAPYFAGLFDGEGTVAIGRGEKTSFFLLSCSIAGTDPRPLYRCVDFFRGNITGPHDRNAPNSKPAYAWRSHSRIAENFLRIVMPFLIIKRERAELALEFRTLFVGENILPRGVAVASARNADKRSRILDAREAMFLRMRTLNRRGLAHAS